mgnify:CR=1 FL=1
MTVNFSRRQNLDLAMTLHLAQGVAGLKVVDTVRRWAVFKICGCEGLLVFETYNVRVIWALA